MALHNRRLTAALMDYNLRKNIDERTSAFIIAASGKNLSRAIQDWESAKVSWSKLQSHFAGKTMIKKLSVLIKFWPLN